MRTTALAAFLATLTLGLTIGLLVGLSETPVVGVVLPILFSVIGGTTGLYFARADIRSPTGRQSVGFTSAIVFALCLGTLAGVWQGINLRSQSRPWSVIPGESGIQFPPAGATGTEAVEWLLLDAKLHMMGLGSVERLAILEKLNSDRPSTDVPGFDKEVAWLYQVLESLLPDEGVVKNRDEWLELLQPLKALHDAVTHSEVSVEPTVFAQDVAELAQSASLLTDDEDDRAYLAKQPDGAERIRAFQLRLRNLATSLPVLEPAVVRANSKLDEFFSADRRGVMAAGAAISRHLASVDSSTTGGRR